MHSCVLSLVVVLGLTTVCSFVNTFGVPHGLSKRWTQTSSSSLRTSLWDVDLVFDLEGDDGDGESVPHKQAKQIEIIKYKNLNPSEIKKSLPKKKKEKSHCPLCKHLGRLEHSIRDPKTRVIHMDDELKRMESRYHSLTADDTPQLSFPLGNDLSHYNGDIVRPNERAYEMVIHMYSRANLGEEGVYRAENLVARYEKFNPSHVASTKMIAFAMKACIHAGDLERSEHWLDRLERKYELTLATSDYPGYYIYNPFVYGLKGMTGLSDKRAAKRSMEILEKICPRSEIATLCNLFPARHIYVEIMKYQVHGYKGAEAFYRIEKVFRQLQKNYKTAGNNPGLKPSIDTLIPVFIAARQSPRDAKVAKMVTALFDEYDQLYRATGDANFRPNSVICSAVNWIYDGMIQRTNKLSFYANRIVLLIEWMEEHEVNFKDPRDKIATFNRIIRAAESKMPDDPLSDPLKTRKIFMVALNIFKKFHDNENSLSPNKATYQVFLRAVSKLPEGEARSKLAAKAFELCRQNDCVTSEAVFKLHRADPDYAMSLLDSTNNLGFDRNIFHF